MRKNIALIRECCSRFCKRNVGSDFLQYDNLLSFNVAFYNIFMVLSQPFGSLFKSFLLVVTILRKLDVELKR